MELEIGVRLEPRGREGEAPAPEIVEALPGVVARLEAEGLAAVWLGEEWPAAASGLPAALPLCAAVAAVTGEIRIGTAVVPLPVHHPLRVAEDAATVDRISGGRLELGVGLGADPAGLADFGVDESERVGRFEEAIDLIRLAWGPAPLDFRGRYFTVEGVSVHPKPLQPGGPPLWVGAVATAAQVRAARRHAGLLLPRGMDPDPYLEACAAAGTPPRVAWIAGSESLGDGAPRNVAAALASDLEARRGQGGVRAQLALGLAIAAGERGAEAGLERVFAIASRLRDAWG